jgi:integrase
MPAYRTAAVDCKKVTVQILADSMTKAWELAQKNEATQEWAARCWKRLLPFFGKMKATDALASAAIMEYQSFRRTQGAANGTINRELAVLSCAFTLGYEQTPRRVPEKLHFTRLPEPKGRQGFVEEKQYRDLAAKCEETYMRAMLALAYNFGFRKAELLTLKVSDVDILGGTIRLRTSKNGEPRQVNLTEETRKLLALCISGKNADESAFTRTELSGKRVPVAEFRGTWETVTKAAKCEGLLFHDLRRSAVRGMIRAGIPEVVCMKISGHKTRAVFDRYNIVSERDLADAAKKLKLSQGLVKVEQVAEKSEAGEHATIQ